MDSENLYVAGSEDILHAAESFPESIHCAMIVGHNPTITDLAVLFSPDEIDNVPTCGILTIDVPSWTDVSRGTLNHFDFPKNTAHLMDPDSEH